MTINPYNKNLIKIYVKELNQGRRIARLKRILRQMGEDTISISPEAKRRQMVEKISREIIENLLTSESENPIVLEIKADLEKEVGMPLIFKYPPPNGDDLHILKKTAKGLEELTPQEKEQILQKLWQITINKVNKTML
ncbi:MAG TPA: hypothetical protein DIT19_01670 [Desulfonauticus sp.]|jgi:hypothetical protein|nr:MAG: hypothetical protein XD41_0385 [Desulfonauticus sp. 38_4375]MDK2920709.1 hypothetical protein [Desulfonauticus sp.]HCO11922.1 hypothetical protein [Desulfonauticus sp.]